MQSDHTSVHLQQVSRMEHSAAAEQPAGPVAVLGGKFKFLVCLC